MEPMVPKVVPMGSKMMPMGPQMMPLGSKVSADGTQSGANGTQSGANDAQSGANGTQRPHSWKSLESDPPGEGRCRFFDRRLQRNGRSGTHFPDPPDPADPADQVSATAARNHPSTRAGGQDDVSLNKLPQMIVYACARSLLMTLRLTFP